MATKPRARRKAAETAGNPSAKLIEALQFVALAQEKKGPVQVQHCILGSKWACASNGILTAAVKIEEDLECRPNTLQLIEALKTAADADQVIAQENEAILTVRAGLFRGAVACAPPSALPWPAAPDPRCAAVDSRVFAALDAVQFLAIDESPDAFRASVLLRAGSAIATDGSSCLEYWHGVDLPPQPMMMIPRRSVQALIKSKKTPVGFGYSSNSVTFYFDDESWMKTQLYAGNYPPVDKVFPEQVNAWPLPEGFFRAVNAISNFTEEGIVIFNNGKIASSIQETAASTFAIEGLANEMAFAAKRLVDCEKYMKSAFFDSERHRVLFFGDSCRGVIMGLDTFQRKAEEERLAKARTVITDVDPKRIIERGTTGFDDMDDEIPF